MAVFKPENLKGTVATPQGLVVESTGELIIAKPLTQSQIDEWNGNTPNSNIHRGVIVDFNKIASVDVAKIDVVDETVLKYILEGQE